MRCGGVRGEGNVMLAKLYAAEKTCFVRHQAQISLQLKISFLKINNISVTLFKK